MRWIGIAMLLSSGAIGLHAADVATGTWNLNLAKSRFDPGPPPKSQTRVYREEKGEMKAIVTTVYKNGNSVTVHYPATYDGKEYPVVGSPDTDGIAMTKIDDYTAESVLMHAGKRIGSTRRTVSRDGQTMTITFKGVGESGEPVDNRTFYEKVKE